MQFKSWRLIKAKVKGKCGFTLLETMIGMMIFAVGISAALYMQVEGINAHTRSKQHVEAAHGIVQQAETIGLAVGYDDQTLVDDGGNATPGDGDLFGTTEMPIQEQAYASYTVRRDDIVQDIKMVYMSNRIKAGAKAYTVGRAHPYLGRGSSD